MTTRTFAHVSDLHLGRDAATDAAAGALCEALVAFGVDDVLVTGDVTDRGRAAELARFERTFAPVRERLVVVPGNHDRAGDDLSGRLMGGPRVQVTTRPGLHLVRFDSTHPRNRSLLQSHGELPGEDAEAIVAAAGAAPPGALVVLLLHHHLLHLPGDHLGETLLGWLGWPHAAELRGGGQLVRRLRGRCDLVLHGHRHRPAERVAGAPGRRPLRVVNAGSAPALGAVRVFRHRGGRVVDEDWLVFETGRGRRGAQARRLQVRALPAAA